MAKGRLAIIAGSGLLPSYVATAARQAGENPFIIALKDEADRSWKGFDHAVIGVGDFAALSRIFEGNGIDRVVMSGGVRRRPEWREVRPTLRTLVKLPSTIRTLLAGGDDTVLRMVITLIEENGRRVVGAHEIAPDLLASVGPLGAVRPSLDNAKDIARAAEAADALGRLDVGQGSVSVGGRIVALEGVEGTDSMLERVAELRSAGRISQRRRRHGQHAGACHRAAVGGANFSAPPRRAGETVQTAAGYPRGPAIDRHFDDREPAESRTCRSGCGGGPLAHPGARRRHQGCR